MSSDAIDTALVAKLTGDVTLTAAAPGGVHQDVAPDGTVTTHVVWTLISGPDVALLGTSRAIEEPGYQVLAVATSKAAADAAAARIDALLEGGTLTISGYVFRGMWRARRVGFKASDGTETWYHRGGIYQLSVDVA